MVIALAGTTNDSDALIGEVKNKDIFLAAECINKGAVLRDQVLYKEMVGTLKQKLFKTRLFKREILETACFICFSISICDFRSGHAGFSCKHHLRTFDSTIYIYVFFAVFLFRSDKKISASPGRKDILVALIKLGGKDVCDILIQTLKSRIWALRYTTESAINFMQYREILPDILLSLHHKNHGLRQSAIAIAAAMDKAEAIDSIITLINDPNKKVREACVFALSDFGSEAALRALVACTKDKNAHIRATAIFQLSNAKYPSWIPFADKPATDMSKREQLLHQKTLRRMQTAAGIPFPLEGLTDKSTRVRLEAVEAMSKVKDPETVPILIGYLLKKPTAFVRFKDSIKQGLELFDFWTDLFDYTPVSSGALRVAAATALGEIGDTTSYAALQKSLQDKSRNGLGLRVCDAAAEALKKLQPENGTLTTITDL